jgi:hypothetical protein
VAAAELTAAGPALRWLVRCRAGEVEVANDRQLCSLLRYWHSLQTCRPMIQYDMVIHHCHSSGLALQCSSGASEAAVVLLCHAYLSCVGLLPRDMLSCCLWHAERGQWSNDCSSFDMTFVLLAALQNRVIILSLCWQRGMQYS